MVLIVADFFTIFIASQSIQYCRQNIVTSLMKITDLPAVIDTNIGTDKHKVGWSSKVSFYNIRKVL